MALPEKVSPEIATVLERLIASSTAITRAMDWADAALADRNVAIVDLGALGWTVSQISEFTQLSEQQIYKIRRVARLGASATSTDGED